MTADELMRLVSRYVEACDDLGEGLFEKPLTTTDALHAKATELHGEILAEVYRLHADAEFGARWRQDSSLATWFPITAEKLKPLTDKQIAELVGDYYKHADQHDMSPHSIVRAIEAAHGIGA